MKRKNGAVRIEGKTDREKERKRKNVRKKDGTKVRKKGNKNEYYTGCGRSRYAQICQTTPKNKQKTPQQTKELYNAYNNKNTINKQNEKLKTVKLLVLPG